MVQGWEDETPFYGWGAPATSTGSAPNEPVQPPTTVKPELEPVQEADASPPAQPASKPKPENEPEPERETKIESGSPEVCSLIQT